MYTINKKLFFGWQVVNTHTKQVYRAFLTEDEAIELALALNARLSPYSNREVR